MIEACMASETGLCRRVNEDRGFADAARGVIAVFDGSAANGAAAQVALELTSQFAVPSNSAGAGAALKQLAYAIDAKIRQSSDVKLNHSATTFLVAVIRGRQVTVAHVGDGRAYLFRDGSLTQLSRDHTLAEELTASGALSREEAMNSPNRGVITRALGFGANCEPDVIDIQAQTGDIVLLCTDGVWTALDETQLTRALVDGAFETCAGRITELAASPGQDNSTVAAVRV